MEPEIRLDAPPTYPERRKRAPVHLRGSARRALGAIAELVAPERKKFSFDAAEHCIAHTEDFIAYMPRVMRWLFPLGLVALEWAAVPLAGRFTRFSKLPREPRLRYAERLKRWRILSPLADLWTAMRGVAALAFYNHPEVAAHIGYVHQPWIDKKVAERKAIYGTVPEPW